MAIICPSCCHENIDGADTCENCQHSLTGLKRPGHSQSPIGNAMIRDRIASLDPRQPIAVPSDTSVAKVLQMMQEKGVGSMLIADDGKLTGIFSERDAVMRLGSDFGSYGNRPISEFMTSSPDTLTMENKVIFAVHKMALGGYRHIPIVSGADLVGLVSIRDILRYTSDKLTAMDTAAE